MEAEEVLNDLAVCVLRTTPRKVANLAGCFLIKDAMSTILAVGDIHRKPDTGEPAGLLIVYIDTGGRDNSTKKMRRLESFGSRSVEPVLDKYKLSKGSGGGGVAPISN